MKWIWVFDVSDLNDDKDRYQLYFTSKKKALSYAKDRYNSELNIVGGSRNFMSAIYKNAQGISIHIFLSKDYLN